MELKKWKKDRKKAKWEKFLRLKNRNAIMFLQSREKSQPASCGVNFFRESRQHGKGGYRKRTVLSQSYHISLIGWQ